MRGTLERCWLFTYRMPVQEARPLVPAPLQLVTHNGEALWNLVVCRVEEMRPRGIPAAFGLSYWHVGYRLHVRHGDVEGLYFVRSDCDSALMSLAGNFMTDYNFHTAGVEVSETDARVHISVRSADAPAEILLDRAAPPALPDESSFSSLPEAIAALKTKPFGLSVDARGRVRIVKIIRNESAWKSRAVKMILDHWAFLSGRPVRPELCLEVDPIAYQWNRGVTPETSAAG